MLIHQKQEGGENKGDVPNVAVYEMGRRRQK